MPGAACGAGAGHPGRLPPVAAAGRSSPPAGRPSTGVPRSVIGIRYISAVRRGRVARAGAGAGARRQADLRRAAGPAVSGSFRCAAGERQGFLGQGRPVLAGCRVQVQPLRHHPAGAGFERPALAVGGQRVDPLAGELDDKCTGRYYSSGSWASAWMIMPCRGSQITVRGCRIPARADRCPCVAACIVRGQKS